MKTVFINCSLFDGIYGRGLRRGVSVWVQGGKITDIKDGFDGAEGFKIIDLEGKYLSPGLVNPHVHLFGTGKPSKALGGGSSQQALVRLVNSKLGHGIIDKIVESNAKTQLLSGVTTLRSVGDFCYSDVRARDKIYVGRADGPRMLVSGPAITVSGGHGDGTFAITADTEEGLRECVRVNAENNVDLIKICVTGGVMDAKKRGEPGEVKMTLAQARAVCDEAHRRGFRVASHTESPQGVEIAVEAGVDTIEHGSALCEETAAKLKAYGGAVVPTYSPALPLCRLDPEITKMPEMCVFNGEIVAQGMIDCAKDALKYGISLGIGTDASCPFSTQYNTWREAVYFSKLVGVDNEFALSTLTIGNARVIGTDKIAGSVEIGKSADMIVTANDPLEDLSALRDVETVIARGIIYDKPEIKKNEFIEAKLDELTASL